MKHLLTLITLAVGFSAMAQTLEHEYPAGVALTYAKVNQNEGVYYSYAAATKTCTIYSLSHTLIKSVVFQISETDGTLSQVSKVLFNTDGSNFEFLVIAGKKLHIIGDDGAVTKTISAVSGSTGIYGYPVNTVNGTKLIVYSYHPNGNVHSVYSLSGQLFLGKKEVGAETLAPYPNPANDIIAIAKPTDAAKLTVFDTEGKAMEVIELQSGLLNVATYPTGIYYYDIDGKYTGKFIKE